MCPCISQVALHSLTEQHNAEVTRDNSNSQFQRLAGIQDQANRIVTQSCILKQSNPRIQHIASLHVHTQPVHASNVRNTSQTSRACREFRFWQTVRKAHCPASHISLCTHCHLMTLTLASIAHTHSGNFRVGSNAARWLDYPAGKSPNPSLGFHASQVIISWKQGSLVRPLLLAD